MILKRLSGIFDLFLTQPEIFGHQLFPEFLGTKFLGWSEFVHFPSKLKFTISTRSTGILTNLRLFKVDFEIGPSWGELEELCTEAGAIATTEDGSFGLKCLATDPLVELLERKLDIKTR